jgi:GNAT superfamily N-acetyltransferase
MTITIRQALDSDAEGVRNIFASSYGKSYPYPQFYDTQSLKKMIFDDDTLVLVAEDDDNGQLIGTASIIMDFGRYGDLVGEFGRLVVHPDGRRRGLGMLLMKERLAHAEGRLHVGLVENRVVHAFSQRISDAYGFHSVGFLPHKLSFNDRESVAPYVRHFGQALQLRRNNPRVIPEAFALAELALRNCGITPDVIVDDEEPAYPHSDRYTLDCLTADGYASLFRLQRGRLAHREITGPARLSVGLFRLRASHSTYLLAREEDRIVGAVGYTHSKVERAVNVFELITADERPIRFLLAELERTCRQELDADYVDIDVSAYSPRMQRTVLEMGFLPAAYLPAHMLHRAERRDVIRFVRLYVPFHAVPDTLHEATLPMFRIVQRTFATREILPRVKAAIPNIDLFADLTGEQVRRLASSCRLASFPAGRRIFTEGEADGNAYILLDGRVEITLEGGAEDVGSVLEGECLGEMALLNAAPHSASATASTDVEAAVLSHEDFNTLVRRRPDIGVVVYRNLARGLGEKLHRLDIRVAGGDAQQTS